MHTYKKIGIGLGFVCLVATAFVLLFTPHRVFAAAPTSASDFQSSPGGSALYTLSGPGTIQATIAGQTYTFTDVNTGDTIFNYKPDAGSGLCSGSGPNDGLTLTANQNTGGYSATINNVGTSLVTPRGTGCFTIVNSPVPAFVDNPLNISLVGGTSCPGSPLCPATGGSSGTGATTTAAASCASNFNYGFEWVMCPALNLADSAAGSVNNFVEGQLCFNTGSSLTTTPTCNGNSLLTDSVKSAWSTIKNLATALLVIVMLVMVISQAIGGGALDAYTVRKVLPRLVAVAIIMQISWFLAKWAVDLSNDAGRGIQSLLYFPFVGTDLTKMHLDSILGTNLGVHTIGTNNTFALFGALALITGAFIVSLPGLLLMALFVVMALFTAFFVLVLRKLFILMFIIFIPLALIAYVLPGTEKYWKLWRENFIKLLVMFPLIMGLIAAGRIFAFIVSGGANSAAGAPTGFIPHLAVAHLGPLPVPYLASVTSFADLAIILAVYFGPYFLLPQTFKWGGATMQLAGRGVKATMDKASKPAQDYLQWRQGLSPWKQARAARKAEVERRSKLGFAEGLQAGGTLGRVRRARLGGVGLRGREGAIRGTIAERAGEALEAEMLPQVRKENVDHLNGYLTTQGIDGSVEDRVDASVARINASRARMGLPAVTAGERAEMITNFRRFDNNGWRNNRVFASTAIQATGAAGSLDAGAEDAAQAAYIGNRTGRDREEAAARFGAIRFQAHTAARGSGQYASDSGSLGGIPPVAVDPTRSNAEWRRVSDISQVGFGSMGNVIGGTEVIDPVTGVASHPDTGFSAALERTMATGGMTAHSYEFTDPQGHTHTFNAAHFDDPEVQNFINEMARVRSGQRKLDQRQTQQFNREYQALLTRLGPQGAALDDLIAQKAAHKHYTD